MIHIILKTEYTNAPPATSDVHSCAKLFLPKTNAQNQPHSLSKIKNLVKLFPLWHYKQFIVKSEAVCNSSFRRENKWSLSLFYEVKGFL